MLNKTGFKELGEYPFSSDLKRMSVVYQLPEGQQSAYMAYMKGAVELIMDACVSVQLKDKIMDLNDQLKAEWMKNVDAMASQGLRVLALASKAMNTFEPDEERSNIEKDMTLLGIVGLYDPPRKFCVFGERTCSYSDRTGVKGSDR